MARQMDRWDEHQFEDKTLTCVDCGGQFIFQAGERRFFSSKGLAEPKRCPLCRRQRKATINPDRGRDER
jgi:hypothetical protein